MMQSGTAARIRKEIGMLNDDPPPGVVFFPLDDAAGGESLDKFEAQITGPDETPYSQGIFRLEVLVPPRYPFEPPKVRFITPIYHPNIDDGGRICLDTLKMQPQGSWSPSVNISTLLTSIRLLMAHPNPDDGLMADITELYRNDLAQFEAKAKALTRQHASQAETSSSTATAAFSTGDSTKDTKPCIVVGGDNIDDEDTVKVNIDAEKGHSRADGEEIANYEDEYEDEYVDESDPESEPEDDSKRQKIV